MVLTFTRVFNSTGSSLLIHLFPYVFHVLNTVLGLHWVLKTWIWPTSARVSLWRTKPAFCVFLSWKGLSTYQTDELTKEERKHLLPLVGPSLPSVWRQCQSLLFAFEEGHLFHHCLLTSLPITWLFSPLPDCLLVFILDHAAVHDLPLLPYACHYIAVESQKLSSLTVVELGLYLNPSNLLI